MTTLTAALKGIRAEISATIRKIGPEERVSADVASFKEHDYADKGQPIEEIAGPARLFEIKTPMFVRNARTGSDTEDKIYHLPVTFLYPRGRISEKNDNDWSDIANGDIDKLKHTFVIDPGGSGVSGVYMRWIDMENPVDIEPSAEDPVDYYTVTFILHIQVAYS